eukprot:TRINITY_DN28428_c0_g1_i2.p1 TRINITY_DN28428_c0_g1~~TRINITY_DN28428_c0_g1_i2.p1  ORF type:complete len:136 (+),score=41.19 TRINITY_DN28428_c0_g1_i2:95-502(+)
MRFLSSLVLVVTAAVCFVQNADAALPPWWILNGVKPAGPLEEVGSYKIITFTKEQQDQFSIDSHGKVLDQAKFSAAVKDFKEGKKVVKREEEKKEPAPDARVRRIDDIQVQSDALPFITLPPSYENDEPTRTILM